ncbi:MAG: hypothetical protein R6V05_03535 [Candidatus Brocadiia bacterium]
MEWDTRTKAIAAAIALLALLGGVLLVTTAGPRYERSGAETADPRVQAALGIIRSAAESPDLAEQSLADDISPRGRSAVLGALNELEGVHDVSLKEATWFDAYLRVTVTYRLADSHEGEATFMFRREDGGLALTGAGQ